MFQNDGIDLSGTITASIESSPRGNSLLLSEVCFQSNQGPLHTKGKMRLFIPHPIEGERIFFRPGDRLETFAKLKIPRNFANPGAFDYASYLARDGVYLLGSVKSARLLTLKKSENWKWRALMVELRQRISAEVQEYFSKNHVESKIANFLLAITIGNREGFTLKDKKLLSRGGIYHIVAISGFHVGLIAWIAFLFLSFLKCPDRWSCIIIVLLLFIYLPLSGARSSAMRAILMATLYLISRIIRRPSNILITVFFSAFLLLLLKPKFLFDPGFQLTYAATLSIIFFFPIMSKLMAWGGILRSPLLLALSAQIGVIPILAYHFNSILWISLLTNAVILPMMVFILPLAFALEGALFIDDTLSHIIAWPLTMLIKFIFSIASLYGYLPLLSYRIPNPPIYLIILYYLSAWSLRYLKGRRFKAISFVLLIFFLMLITTYPFPPERKELFVTTFIDVGQGESAFIVSPDGTSVLIDGGGRWGKRFDAGEMVVSKFLWNQGRKSVHTLILSHLHADHAGGAPSILENFHVNEIILSEREKSEKLFSEIEDLCLTRGTKIHFVYDDLIIHFDHFSMEIFQHDYEEDHLVRGNERSLIVKVTCGQVHFLFTGDAPSSVEKALVESGKNLRSNILKIAHHGSNDASSQIFLNAVKPETCIISCGADNQWGHPMPQVLERITNIGAELYRTDKHGAIIIQTDKTSYMAESYLRKSPSPIH